MGARPISRQLPVEAADVADVDDVSPSAPDAPRGTHAAGDHAGKLASDAAQLAGDLRRRVGVCTFDSWPATYMATLQDEGRIFRASADGPGPDHIGDHYEAERAVINRIVDDVVAQALAARKAQPERTPK